ncbi:hypothetical protein BZG36_03088 [Bifiguratus adelaidae]|uniref:Oxysterol-binding protein n=1 Tax=Bifiguratus adelaidae TaxID=1938954 RepID=A0A261XYW1_9FUNG|nr:hypothetical protein BZG36_03088 [Bifiguratus adelaidae]
MTKSVIEDASNGECTEVLADEPKSIILGIIAQLSKGADLHRVTLPTFVLEPRSLLEKLSDFISHPDLIIDVNKVDDPVERFVSVVRFYLSGWHIRPKGVKKPYNPILGEFFKCQYCYPNDTRATYIAEQVSHHPPISAFHMASPANNLIVRGEMRPKSKFLGNSVASISDGITHVEFTDRKETYDIAYPNVYARGIVFGTMIMELADTSSVRCKQTDLICELEFKAKGYFSGSYNMLCGVIKRVSTGEKLYELSGKWSEILYIKDCKTGEKREFFNALKAKIIPKACLPLEKQDWNESRRLWNDVTTALKANNIDAATAAKSAIEDDQRARRKEQEANNAQHEARFFRHIPGVLGKNSGPGEWVLKSEGLSDLDSFVQF